MNIQDTLIRKRVPAGGSEERLWSYQSETGRVFEIRQFGRQKFLLGEFKPNGRIVQPSSSGDQYHNCPAVTDALLTVSPNELSTQLKSVGVDPESIIRVGNGIGLTSFYHDSLAAICQEISAALTGNVWYSKQIVQSAADLQAQDKAHAFDSVQFWESCLSRLSIAESQPGLFKGCHTAVHAVLTDDTKKAILSYLNAPSQPRWLSIRNTLITVSMTLWSAWCRFDPKASKSGSSGYPSADVLRNAIRSETAAWGVEVKERLSHAIKQASDVDLPPVLKLEVINGIR